MPHDFKRFPELTNRQMQFYYFDSPHEQITRNFEAKIIKVTDGDTVRVEVDFRNFTFPIRLAKLAAPELDEEGGEASQSWLESEILGQEVDVLIDPRNRVEKWGRLLGELMLNGINVGEDSIRNGHAVSWENRKIGGI